jgi:hypothetical protein
MHGSSHFTPAEAANFLAAKAVAHATAFLDGRNNEAELARHADAVQLELMAYADPSTNIILDPVRLLNVAMMRTAVASGEGRQDRWRQVMGALVKLVQHESVELRISGAQRS